MGQQGGGGAARQCTEVLTRFCCGDGLCDGPENEDNCAADCSGDNPTSYPDTTSMSTPTVTTTPSTTVSTCNPWCSQNGHPRKCQWRACSGCDECNNRRLQSNDD